MRQAGESGVAITLNDTLLAADGRDTLTGIESISLTGTLNDDRLDASQFTLGSVTLNGNEDHDTLIGSAQADRLVGGFGNDLLAGGGGNDNLDGGFGNDTIRGERGDDTITARASEGPDTVEGGTGVDRLDFLAEGQAFTRTATGITVAGQEVVTLSDPPESLTADGTAQPRDYLLSEGATGSFFDLDVAVANPNTAAVPIQVTYLKDDGSTSSRASRSPHRRGRRSESMTWAGGTNATAIKLP